jgi:SAM-dependent methyltransferase
MGQAWYDYVERPKQCAPDDFWDQVRRTVNGKPLPQEQLDLIFSMIRQALRFQPDDALLDLCCGNGRLGFEFFDEVREYLGVDMSPTLIEVGQKNFQSTLTHMFLERTLDDYLREEKVPTRFTKVLWFSAMQYFYEHDIRNIFSLLFTRFTGVRAMFIGSIPDISRTYAYFQNRPVERLDDPTSAIGVWFRAEDIQKMAADCGWSAEIRYTRPKYYQAHYRFNALLTRWQ